MKTLIFSDIHANLAALEAVLEAERTWDEVFFLGDAVLAGPNPNEVLDVLRDLKGIFICGNHDLEVIEGIHATEDRSTVHALAEVARGIRRKTKDLFHVGHAEAYEPDHVWRLWTEQQISEANREFLAGFIETAHVERAGLTIRLIHGDIPKEWGYGSRIWPDSPEDVFDRLAEHYPERYILFGHSHVQFRKEIAERVFINCGGLGQPRLGRPLAAYVVLGEEGFDLRAVPYDTEKTAEAMDRVGIVDAAFVQTWKACYRKAVLPERYQIRDLSVFENDYL
jgi:predicted phosphodiesterase